MTRFLSNTYLNESIAYTQIACEDIVDEVPIECIDDITITDCSLDSFRLERLTGQLVPRGAKTGLMLLNNQLLSLPLPPRLVTTVI